MDKRMYETHEQWSGMTRENFFREFRAFQEQRIATLDKITFVGQELLAISKNFAQTDAEVVQTSARGGLDLNLMINEQKRGYAKARTDEERDAYSQEADRIRDAMRQQGYDESEIMQKTDPAMSEDQVMARAWDETRKWAEADPKGFGLMFAGRPLVQGAIANIEAARNTYNEARKGEIVKAIVDYAKGYTNFYTDLGYKLAESASNPGETVDKLTHSPTQAKTEFIASLASGLIFGRHMKKEHHGEGGSGGGEPGAGGGTGNAASSRLISGKGIYTQYSGGLKQAAKEDAGADLLAEKLGGQSRMIFNNDPKGREFDVISDEYIGQTKTSMNSLSSQFREQAKATIEAALETDRKAYFHFETAPADKVIRQLREYEKRYNVETIIDVSPFE